MSMHVSSSMARAIRIWSRSLLLARELVSNFVFSREIDSPSDKRIVGQRYG